MADFTQIIQEINDDINTNGVGAITGAKLNQVLRDMIAAVNAAKTDILPDGSLYGGFAWPNEPPTHGDDHRYFYLAATDGRYTHFNNYEVDGYVVVFSWNENTQNWRYVPLCPNGQAFDDLIENKADKVGGATSGNLAGLDSDGNPTDSGIAASDVATTADLAGKQDTISDLETIRSGAAAGATAYQKPSDGIPASDLAAAVQTSLGKADTAVQTESDPVFSASPSAGITSGDISDWDGKAEPIEIVDASTPPASMLPNTVYKYGTLSGNTTFPPLATPTEPDIANVYCWTFTTPATAPTITWPSGITAWAGGSAPTIAASKNYEVSVMDGIATIIEA